MLNTIETAAHGTIAIGDTIWIAKNGNGERWYVIGIWRNGQVTIRGTRANSWGQVAKRTIDADKITRHVAA